MATKKSGIKKAGKKLVKLGQKLAKTLGKEGKQRVEELFGAAIEVLEGELAKVVSKKDRGPATAARRADRGAPGMAPAPQEAAARSSGRARRPAAARRPAPASRPRSRARKVKAVDEVAGTEGSSGTGEAGRGK